MSHSPLEITIDGHKVQIHQDRQEVRVLDANGAILFSDRIQVAAGSVQGIFSAVQSLNTPDKQV